MKNFKQRVEFFERTETFEVQKEFLDMSHKARVAGQWAADQLGFKGLKRENYMRANLANVVRENEVNKMISRIERDLFEANIDLDRKEIIHHLDEALATSNKITDDK